MKFILFFLISTIFSNSLSDWIDLNGHIIDSKLYKISFNQSLESIIAGKSHYTLDTNTNIIFFENQMRYESYDRIIVANKDSIKLLNKNNSQLFIDYMSNQFNFLFESNLIKIFKESDIVQLNNDCYYINFGGVIDSKIYFKNNKIDVIKVTANNMIIQLSNIILQPLDTLNIYKHFDIDSKSLSTFDLRPK